LRANHAEFDIVLMDVQMPVLDGNETTRRIRNDLQLTDLPIVALTAGALVIERQRALEAGMNDFISKPFDPQSLIRKVRRLVEKARGEPISMVILDTLPAVQADARRKLIPSIDAGVVQQMFGDDLLLFQSLLGRLLKEYVDLTLPIRVFPDDQPMRARLVGRTHKLKGSAGMIGATDVVRLAGAAETALHQGRPVEVVEGILQRLAAALTVLNEEAAPYLKLHRELNANKPERSGGGSADAAQISELCILLENQDLAALNKFKLISSSLGEMLGGLRFNRLCDAIDSLDFRQGAQLLQEAQLLGAIKFPTDALAVAPVIVSAIPAS
jgi:CheY-like chemotaxis protein